MCHLLHPRTPGEALHEPAQGLQYLFCLIMIGAGLPAALLTAFLADDMHDDWV
jgi:hypothetical protein